MYIYLLYPDGVGAVFSAGLDHGEAVVQVGAGGPGVARREDVAPAGGGPPDAFPRLLRDLRPAPPRQVVHGDVPHQDEPVAVLLLHPADVDARRRVEGVKAVHDLG